MFVITGITGNVGGEVARRLLAAKKPVRAVVRDASKGEAWAKLGCEVAVAEVCDVEASARAFAGAEAVFVMLPPVYDPAPGFAEHKAMGAAVRAALQAAHPGRVVYLSTIGAQATQENLLTAHTVVENILREVSLPIAILRPGWFMENAAWDVASARDKGVISSFLTPAEKGFPMVATEDIGRLAAELMQESWSGHRLVELTGPRPVSPNDIAETFAKLLGRPVAVEMVARETREPLFVSQGMKNPTPRIRMLDGFNEGWICFENESEVRRGRVELETVLKTLVERDGIPG
jgi:NAD(P)H dehydrogenase (quinone)